MSRLRLAVFDCDGTLVDSQAGIVACMAAAFVAAGHPAPAPEAVRRVVGLPLVDSAARLAPALSPGDHIRLAELYKQAFFDLRARRDFEEPLFPGIAALLEALAAEDVLLGVATGKGRRGLAITLDRHGLRHRFATLQTADDARGKPHPEMLQRAMAEAGADPADTAMIGDTSYDIEMALSAGTAAIGVAWGYHPPEELSAAGAHAVAATAADVAPAWRALDAERTGRPG